VILLDKWLEDKNCQGNGENKTEIGPIYMKPSHHLVVICTRKTITTYAGRWLVLVQNCRGLSDFSRQMARRQEFPREWPELD